MRLITVINIILVFIIANASAQNDLIKTKQYLLSFKQAKLSLGAGLEFGGGSLYRYEGTEPSVNEVMDPFFFTAGALLDLYAPKSRISFATAAQFSYLNYTYSASHNQKFNYNDITQEYLMFPLFAKISMGNKFSAVNLVFFGGISLDIPFMYKDSSTLIFNVIHKDAKILKTTLSEHVGIAVQLNFRGKDRDNLYIDIKDNTGSSYGRIIFPRIWITLKASRSPSNILNQSYESEVFEGVDNNTLDFHDLRFSLGFVYFLGSNQKHEIR
jgi:hypothetical protein